MSFQSDVPFRAHDRIRTGDLVLTKDALCQLSYIGHEFAAGIGCGTAVTALERETGIEPATNSLEGCDSTTELLPRTLLPFPSVRPCDSDGPGRLTLVARGGFEPPKPLGRQIYSLLRLTAPQPRQTLR